MNTYNINIINREDKTLPKVIKVPLCVDYFEDDKGNIYDYNEIITNNTLDTIKGTIANSICIRNKDKYKIKGIFRTKIVTILAKTDIVAGFTKEMTLSNNVFNGGEWLYFLNISNYEIGSTTNYGNRIEYAYKIEKTSLTSIKITIKIVSVFDTTLDHQYLELNVLGVKI